MAKRSKQWDRQVLPIGFELTYEQYAQRRHWDRLPGFNHESAKAMLTVFHEFIKAEVTAGFVKQGIEPPDFEEMERMWRYFDESDRKRDESKRLRSTSGFGLRLAYSRD